ncbi:MAG: hypothetical protein ACKO8U_00410 [Pirellula sp.]
MKPYETSGLTTGFGHGKLPVQDRSCRDEATWPESIAKADWPA